MPRVVRHQRQVVSESNRGDLHVRVLERFAATLKGSLDLCEAARGWLVEGQNGDHRQDSVFDAPEDLPALIAKHESAE